MVKGPSRSAAGGGTFSTTRSSSGPRSLRSSVRARAAQPSRPEAYTTGKSSCSSVAPRAQKRSKVSFTAASGSQPGRSILFTTRMGFNPSASALRVTKRVWGMGPSKASTSRHTESTILSTRSTSPPKSAWPGVSTMLIRVPFQVMAVNFARMVMPRSRSRSFESMAQSATTSPGRKEPAWCRKPSTRVVLPWSTWAMMAMFRTS
jgi:hypothetical protein